jgi:hypothetical protein
MVASRSRPAANLDDFWRAWHTGAKADVSAEYAADLIFRLLSPELYLLFVRDRGWPADAWERWVFDTLRQQLCA